jgi:hypothetical protein
MKEIVSRTVAERRFLMALVAIYAAVALGIAAVGIFGVMACQVAQRTMNLASGLPSAPAPAGCCVWC